MGIGNNHENYEHNDNYGIPNRRADDARLGMLLQTVNKISDDLSEFKDSTNNKITKIQVDLAILNQKILTASGVMGVVTAAVVTYLVEKILK